MQEYSSAVSDFRRARSRAALQSILAKFTGGESELLSYEEVRRQVSAAGVVSRTVRDVPLDAIVGSVGRYQDFTRTFLPKQDSDQDRWVRVKVATKGMTGLPPVELYQIGEVYFVIDGHHRISVAREMGQPDIQAYVTEVRSKVPLEVATSPDDLLLKAEEAEFLSRTKIDELYPDVDLSVTCPGRYHELKEHIEVHRYYMGLEQHREIPYAEAVAHWYEQVYLPIVRIINDQGIMYDFPGRTETDLYLWIGRHRTELEDLLGWDVPVSSAAADLADSEGQGGGNLFSRLGQRVLDVIVPEELEAVPKAGQWRREKADEDKLFADILVGLSGQESSWLALEQAIKIARREDGRLRGLYVVSDRADQNMELAKTIEDRFYWRCGEVGVEGRFVTEAGPVARILCQRARWSDLLVVNVAHRPGDSPRSRWTSGFRTILQRCTRPILAVPDEISPMNQPMLAYDGSPQAEEALFVATYLSEKRQAPLAVLLIQTSGENGSYQERIRRYLEPRRLAATYSVEPELDVATLLTLATELGCDSLVMGAPGGNPMVEAVTGNPVMEILNSTTLPVLICR